MSVLLGFEVLLVVHLLLQIRLILEVLIVRKLIVPLKFLKVLLKEFHLLDTRKILLKAMLRPKKPRNIYRLLLL